MTEYTIYFVTRDGEVNRTVQAKDLEEAGRNALLEIDSSRLFLGFVWPHSPRLAGIIKKVDFSLDIQSQKA